MQIFDPTACVNVFADTDNGCNLFGATTTAEEDLNRNENFNLKLYINRPINCWFSAASP